MDPNQEDRESVPERWRGQAEKCSNIIRLSDEMIIEHKDGLKGKIIEILIKVDQKATQEGIWLGSAGSIRIFLGKIYAENIIIATSGCFISRVQRMKITLRKLIICYDFIKSS